MRTLEVARQIDPETRVPAVVKSVRCERTEDSQCACEAHREATAYERLRDLAFGAGLRPVPVLRIVREPGVLQFWLKDLGEPIGSHIDPDQLRDSACAVAEFSARAVPLAASIGESPFPALDRRTALRVASDLDSRRDDPWLSRLFPGGSMDECVTVLRAEEASPWESRRRAPTVLCHLDANARNLFPPDRGGGATWTAVDWGRFGGAPLGTDLTALIAGTHLLDEEERYDLAELERSAMDGFRHGLSRVGLRYEEEELMRVYVRASAARCAAYSLVRAPQILTADGREQVQRVLDLPIERAIDRLVETRRLYFERRQRL